MPTPDRPLARIGGAALVLYAVSAAALGALLASAKFVYVFAPLPAWFPAADAVARVYGALLLVSSLALLWPKTVPPASRVVTSLFLVWLVLVHAPRIVATPEAEGLWSGAAQLASIVAAGWIVIASLGAPPSSDRFQGFYGERGVRSARYVFAAALVMFGVHHFPNAADGAGAVPPWLPFPVAWVYLTGVAHIAAGVAIALGVLARWAAILEFWMILAFVVLVHVRGVVSAPGDLLQWSMLVDAALLGGAAGIVAGSLGAEKK